MKQNMEIISMDVKAFDALAGHVEAIERKAEALCRRQEDVSLKKWLDNQDVCDVLGISKRTLQTYREKGLLPFSRIRHKIFYKPEDVGKLLQSSHYPNTAAFIDKHDPRVADLFRRLEKAGKALDKLESSGGRTLKGERFVTDEELSRLLKISRRTLQEYRTARIIPYYLIQGKVLYMESEIQKFLEDSRKKCIGGQEWV